MPCRVGSLLPVVAAGGAVEGGTLTRPAADWPGADTESQSFLGSYFGDHATLVHWFWALDSARSFCASRTRLKGLHTGRRTVQHQETIPELQPKSASRPVLNLQQLQVPASLGLETTSIGFFSRKPSPSGEANGRSISCAKRCASSARLRHAVSLPFCAGSTMSFR